MTTKAARSITMWATKRLRHCLTKAYDFASRDPAVLVHDVPLTPQQRASMAALSKHTKG